MQYVRGGFSFIDKGELGTGSLRVLFGLWFLTLSTEIVERMGHPAGSDSNGRGIPSGAKAHIHLANIMYGLKPVPFKQTETHLGRGSRWISEYSQEWRCK